MDGRTESVWDNKKTNIAENYEEWEVVQSHDQCIKEVGVGILIDIR